METQFLEAIFVDSIQHPNFFNGRILTAKDLRDEQTANLRRSHYFGQALGTGVVSGLQVSINSTDNAALEITGGLAINPKGEALSLPPETSLTLPVTEIKEPFLAAPSSPFVPCSPPAANTSTGLITTNYYLLVITSATKFSETGSAPHSGLGTSNNRCTSRYEEVGVQFKLVPLTETDFVSPIPATALDNRSRLAHVCFGTNKLRAITSQPDNDQHLTYGLVDALYEDQRLTECDVPLGVFQFQSNTLRFVDMWAVRRIALPAQHPQTYLNNPFSFYVSSRRPAEAIAFFLQFQDHLEDLYNDTTLSPAQVSGIVASQYFEYLPAAGYLPIQSSSSDRRFRVISFFGADIPTQSLEPEHLRALFHDSLYVEPIRPGIDAVDIYQVIGASTAEPYRIFTRRTPISLPLPEAEEEEEEETPIPIATGDLYVGVLSTTGEEIAPEYIQSVQAVHQKTGKSYSAKYLRNLPSRLFRRNRYRSAVQDAKNQIREKYVRGSSSGQPAEGVDDFTIFTRDPGAYFFNDLPAGTYTIKANSFLKNYYGVARSVKILARIDNLAAVVLRRQSIKRPDDLFVKDDYLTPGGIILDGYLVNPRWPDYYLEWELDILGPDFGVIDPPPEDWELRDDLAVALRLEELLGRRDVGDPRVATADAAIYIHKDYNPAQPSDTITAFVQTQDGSRFPVVPLATDNALDKSASVDRTEIPDFDRATVDRLETVGLAGLDAIASIPTNLLAGVLGQSTDYSSSLITDAQTTLQEDFRAGYLGYPGITKTQSDALKEEFASKVELANASSDAVAAILGNVSGSFATRFLADVRNTVPQAAFDLGDTGIDAASLEALAGIDIASNKAFLDRGATEAGRTVLKDTLGVSDVTLDRYLEAATLDFARGELVSTPEKSVGTLKNVPPDLKTALARASIGSVKELANANPERLATELGVSLAETTEIINVAAATPFSSNAHLTLVALATQGVITAEAVTAAGLNSPGALARADTSTLESIGLDVNAAQIVKNLSSQLNQLLSRGSMRRFR